MTRLARGCRNGLLLAFSFAFAGGVPGAHAQVPNTATAMPQSEAGTLSGEVTDRRGTPLAGTSVIVTTPGGKQVASSTTDAGGIFRVDSLQPGDYLLKVDAKGFYKKTEKAKVKPRKTETVHIKMRFIIQTSD